MKMTNKTIYKHMEFILTEMVQVTYFKLKKQSEAWGL